MKILGTGTADRPMGEDDARRIVADLAGKIASAKSNLLVLIPDDTRSGPMAMIFRLLQEELRPRCRRVDYMIALGTHPPMSREAIDRHLGIDDGNRSRLLQGSRILQHAWDDPSALRTFGELDPDLVDRLSGGRLRESVPVSVNAAVLDCDAILICGPTFPHEVVGFSGGNKYIFPGIAGEKIIGFFHWLGALITTMEIIGTRDTPVRDVIDEASRRLPVPRYALAWVVRETDLYGLYAGSSEAAYTAAADLSAVVNIRYLDSPRRRVLSMPSPMYTELWTAAKAMYKLEPIVADGGELVIYAPNLSEISVTHGEQIRRVGYHVRDYFVEQMDRFEGISRCVLAHSTHVKGAGTFRNGVERPRIQVTLASAIPEDVCRAVNLGYRDPAGIDPESWEESADPDSLVVRHAGEVLFRLAAGRG